jgi:hypothetical protein
LCGRATSSDSAAPSRSLPLTDSFTASEFDLEQGLPGDPHALLLEHEVASFRPEALDRLGLTRRETEVLRAPRWS